VLAALLLVSIPTQDALGNLYPLLVVLALRAPSPAEEASRRRARLIQVAVMAAPLGLLPLIKLSTVPGIAAAVVVGAGLLLSRRERLATALLVGVPAVLVLVLWLAIGQPLGALVDYVRTSAPVISGYSGSMGVPELSRYAPGLVPWTYVVVSVVLGGIALVIAGRRLEGLAVAAMIAATLFLTFKSGFVRPDGHMQVGAGVILVVACVVAAGVRRPWMRAAIAVVAIVGAVLTFWSSKTQTTEALADSLRLHTLSAPKAAVQRVLDPGHLDRQYAATLREIRRQDAVPRSSGRVDLYSYSQAELFARHLRWDPRPVFQSYVAYTPELAELNSEHLAEHGAPTVLFSVAPIDGRLPGLEDGNSWLPLLEHYQLRNYRSDLGYLALTRRAVPRELATGSEVRTLRGRLGKRLVIPPPESAWMVSFDLRETLVGKARRTLWTPPLMLIDVRTSDGRSAVTRFIPAMARPEFVLSPFVANTADMNLLFSRPDLAEQWRRVTSIRITFEGGSGSSSYDTDYTLKLRPLDLES
jgi:hypothetical protein